MRKRLLSIIFILLIATLFAPLFSSFVREAVVIPFLYIFWILNFLLTAIPQTTFWACFVALMFFIMVVNLMQWPASRQSTKEVVTTEPQRVAQWIKLIENVSDSTYYKWRLAQQLQKLMLEIIAHQEDQSITETLNQLRQNMLEMPPDIKDYFQTSLQPLIKLSPGSRFSQKRSASPLDLDPVIVAAYLEELNRIRNESKR